MKKLTHEELLKEAKRCKISVYLLIKRQLNYRKKDPRDAYRTDNCFECKYATLISYKDRKDIPQCSKIGLMDDWEHYADIQEGYICNSFKRGMNNL